MLAVDEHFTDDGVIPYTRLEALRTMREYFSRSGAKLGFDEVQHTCRYRSPQGGKCAIGCLIPDSVYEPGFEGNSIYCLRGKYPVILDLFSAEDKDFYGQVQSAHDTYAAGSQFSHLTMAFRVQLFLAWIDGAIKAQSE